MTDTGTIAHAVQALAGTIRRLNPDVLAVLEVGDPEALQDPLDRLSGVW